MRLLDSLRFRLGSLFRRSRLNTELDEELQSHIELRAADLERSGIPAAEALRRARVEFGSQQNFREECQEAAGGSVIESLVRDTRFAFRVLRKSPGFTVVAVGTLALAIGANAVAFAALNAIVLKPLDLPRVESLYSLHRLSNSAAQSYPDYVDLRDRNRSFEDLAAYGIVQGGVNTGSETMRSWIQVVSGNFFDVLGVRPHAGRLIQPSDENGPNSAPYVVISHGFWQNNFQGDPAAIGRVIEINKHPFTIVGVSPPNFHGTLLFFDPDFYVPLVNQEQLTAQPFMDKRAMRSAIFLTMGHLKDGVTVEQAAADFTAISKELEKVYPQEHLPSQYKLSRPSLYGDFMGKPVRNFLTALLVLSGLILLAACANLGSLFTARATDRAREVAVRLALGASRMRIMRQLLTEAVVIALAGGALGLWGSVMLLQWLRAWQPMPQFPIHVPIAPDMNVYVVALLLALASGLLFGAAPVRQVLHTDPYEVVKSGSLRSPGRRITGRDVLVVVQIALCAVLVTSSFVAVRGLVRSLSSEFGFRPGSAMLIEAELSMAGYRGDAIPVMQKKMQDAVRTVPGVTDVALIDVPPLYNGDPNSAYIYADALTDLRPANAISTAVSYKVSPEYLPAAGTTLLAGRNLSPHDTKDAPRVAVVNREFARRVFGSPESAIGGYFKLTDGVPVQVVGLVEDGKYQSLTEDPKLAMFQPLAQAPSSTTTIVVRSEREPQELAGALRAKLREVDPGLPTFTQTWEDSMNLVLFPSRVAAFALGALGAMGALLSITGIFGLAAYSVSKRLKDLGIRIALGAHRNEVLRAALGRAFQLLGFGSAAGLVLGLMASQVLGAVVYQATPRDPFVLAGVVLAMLLLGLLATWIPARRAMSIDPLVLLREQ